MSAAVFRESAEHGAVTAQSYPPAATPVRFRHIDSLRAVAAGLVVWLHFDQFIRPVAGADPWWLGFTHAIPGFVDVGRVGVIIFFAISGFVICRSFGGPREGAGTRFVIRRFCRLYPAFWVSMLGGVWLWWWMHRQLTWRVLAANFTMVPSVFAQEPLIGVYWTLQAELIFYAVCLCLHRTRWLERPVALAGAVIALAALSRVLRIVERTGTTGPVIGWHLYCLGLAVMIWGALFRTVYDQTAGFRRGTFAHRGTWLIVGTTLALPVVLDPRVGWYLAGLRAGPPPSHVSAAFGMWIFALWVACLRVENRVLTSLGGISYSLYLFHVVVMFTLTQILTDHAVIRGWNLPCYLYFLVAALLTVAVSMAVYRWVERPAIALGKRWTGSDRAPATLPFS